MARIESSILVSRSVEETFHFLDIPENHASFIPNMLEFTKTSPGPFGQVGATAHGVLRFLGQRVDIPYEIIERNPNHSLAMKGLLGPIAFKDGYILSSNQGGTQILFWLELTMTGLAKIFSPFRGLIGRIHAWETLTNLKKALEKDVLKPPS
jgi:hypothetical protein